MKFKKKPVVIEAVQFVYKSDWTESYFPEWFHNAVSQNKIAFVNAGKFHNPDRPVFAKIFTIEGVMIANNFDWIIQGVNEEIYPCKPDIFEKTYEKVD